MQSVSLRRILLSQRFVSRSFAYDAKKPPFTKIMAVNRGEIATRILSAGNKLGCLTVGIFSHEDRYQQHRHKAHEAFQIGLGKSSVGAYLDIPSIIDVAITNDVQAVHPGYGFLSENAHFAQACTEKGIVFIGPSPDQLAMFRDKATVRALAIQCGVPVVPVTETFIITFEEPVIIRAAYDGGERGVGFVYEAEELEENFGRASKKALAAFGNGEVVIERYFYRPRHIEVQILGDGTGNVVHLWDRDCSVHRRDQTVIEAMLLPPATREAIHGRHYFIKVHPRIQVEHTVTEQVTGIDIVQNQIRIASGATLKELGLIQENIKVNGVAMQCRLTTEDPVRDNFFSLDTELNKQKTPLELFILNQLDIIEIEGKDCIYSSIKIHGGHIVDESWTYIPREQESREIVSLMDSRRENRKMAQIASDKKWNPLIAIPGSPGTGKSTFLTYFSDSTAFNLYVNETSPIVSTSSFNGAMGKIGADSIGLRIVYGAVVAMGLINAEIYPWKSFYSTFKDSLPSSDEEMEQTVSFLRNIFGLDRPILLLVDELVKAFDEPHPYTKSRNICSKLGWILDNYGDIDIVISALSPTYIELLTTGSQRQVSYVVLNSLIDAGLGRCESYEWANKLIDRVGEDKIPHPIKQLLRNAYLLYSGHPRSLELMNKGFNDPINTTWADDLYKRLCSKASFLTILNELSLALPSYDRCELKEITASQWENMILQTPSVCSKNDSTFRQLVETGNIVITKNIDSAGLDFEISVQAKPLFPLLFNSNKYFSKQHPRTEGANNLFHGLNRMDLGGLFERIVCFTILSRSYDQTSLSKMFSTNIADLVIDDVWSLKIHNEKTGSIITLNNFAANTLVLPKDPMQAGYDALTYIQHDAANKLAFYLQMKVAIPDESAPTKVGSIVYYCLMDYIERNGHQAEYSHMHVIVYIWNADESYFEKATMSAVKEAAIKFARRIEKNEDVVAKFIDNFFDHVHLVGFKDIDKWINPSFSTFPRLLAASIKGSATI
eukprot:gene11375-23811_t